MAVLFDAGNKAIDTFRATANAFCSTLWGIVYKKNDANCTFDRFTEKVLNIPLKVEIRKNNIPLDTFIANGHFAYTLSAPDPTAEYSLHPLNINGGYKLSCPASGNGYKLRLDTLHYNNDFFAFGMECDNSNGFDLFAYMTGLFRFTNNSYINILVGSAACTPHNGAVTLDISPKYTFVSSSITPSSITGQTITWNLSNLEGTNTPNLRVVLNPNGTLIPGDTTCHEVNITPSSGDINPANNTYSLCDSIRASVDPNEKHVAPLGDIEAGQLLTYTINFENLGNDTAFNVHILDTLSGNLDISSFELLGSSHPVATNMLNFENTKIARFDFKDINLGDKDQPETNKGFVIYSIKAKSDLAKGDAIANTAYIYFDINPAVVTNTVLSKIPDPNSLAAFGNEEGIQVYPNPVQNNLFLDNNSGTFPQLTLVNALGQVVLEQKLGKGVNEINMGSLSPGLYYMVLHGERVSRSLKISKQ